MTAVASKPRILVAMSGGVDSSVAALCLREAGEEIEGAYMKNWVEEEDPLGQCPWETDIADARAVAQQLGIPFRVVNLMAEYRSRVVDYLLQGYAEGVTPNPDVFCNREIKFGAFLDYARREGFQGVATGHYARIVRGPHGASLFEGADPGKDQSYFLAMLRPEQVAAAWMPVGDLQKSEVRRLARNAGLATADKKDSQGICFIGKVRMADFLRRHLPDQPGPIVDLDGRPLGRHRGLHYFTLGQRRGLRVASNTPHQAYVVVGKRPATGELVVGFDQPSTPGLHTRAWEVGQLSAAGPAGLPAQGPLEVRVRYRAPRVPATVSTIQPGVLRVKFAEPQRAVAPGQVCAFYDGPQLLGGGVFRRPAAGGEISAS